MRHFLSAASLLFAMACVSSDGSGEPVVIVTAPPPAPPTSCPGYADPDHCPPFATGGPHSISGVVVQRTANRVAPLANARVSGYVFMTTGNGYSMGFATSDATGFYKFTQVPDGFVVLFAGFDQPCSATATVRSDVTRNIEVVTPGVQPGPDATAPFVVSGAVYRQTSAGRQFVPGARVAVEYFTALITATATTDANGRYRLCGIPAGGPRSVYVLIDGKVVKEITATVNSDMSLDIVIP
jgi:hypothetical protein